ncbi:MAG: pyruvate formate lyase-activating protein [Clostridiales bacterium]|nr:MAG: pyruvate formate lyase-activating protein [Clostridiales bacterium]
MNACNRSAECGRVSAIETMGLVDGPGVRTVVFLQGCPLRCKYCHNPETWDPQRGGTVYTPERLAKSLLRYKSYMKHGGVTFSGGEPLLQAAFLAEASALLKENGIHICLDTAGAVSEHPERVPGLLELLDRTDLVLLDLKAADPARYEEITGGRMEPFLAFLELLQQKKKRLWLRSVIVPGINNEPKEIAALQRFGAAIKYVDKIEFLPYHTMGVGKYAALGIEYPLKGVPALSEEEIHFPKNA